MAVADLSFAVAPGEIFGILGPNGSGKSTAVECIAGLRTADGGNSASSASTRRLTRSAPADVGDLLTVLDLKDKRDARFKSLSGGQQQRVSIALALVGNPKVAILDELTTGLDPLARRTTWEVVRRVRDAGATVILVTHFTAGA